MTPRQRGARILGLALTWIGGVIGVLLLLAVSAELLVAGYVAGDGIDVGSGRFACRDQACLETWTTALVIGLGVAALIVALIVLVIRSSTRSLRVAGAIGTAVTTAVVGLAFVASSREGLDGVATTLLFVAAGPASLTLGSLMRMQARRATPGPGKGGRFDSI